MPSTIMKSTKSASVAVLLVLFGAIACSGEANDQPGVGNGIAAQLESSDADCFGQKAELPASGTVTQTIVAARAYTYRTNSPDHVYVSYRVEGEGVFLYLSFMPDLPASFTTEQVRAAFDYAYIEYDLAQPKSVGGRFIVLDSSDLLALADFERLEVSGNSVSFRLVRTNPGHYSKRLSLEDLDPTVDPSLCTNGDISGDCWCEFSGPATTIALDGTFPI
jgi:hypothetical protein